VTQISVFQCDGPACVTTLEEAYDDDDLVSGGWLLVTFSDGEEERTSHLCSHACLAAWASEVAEAEEAEA